VVPRARGSNAAAIAVFPRTIQLGVERLCVYDAARVAAA
jgi:hypothetical protein